MVKNPWLRAPNLKIIKMSPGDILRCLLACLRCARAKSQKSQNRRHVVREVPSRSFGAASRAPCGLAGGSVSHQRSPPVLQGCQRAKRPCSCPNKTLATAFRVCSARGARVVKNPDFRAQSPKSSKSSWLLRGPDPKTRFEACERAGGSKSTKICGSQNPRGRLCSWLCSKHYTLTDQAPRVRPITLPSRPLSRTGRRPSRRRRTAYIALPPDRSPSYTTQAQ